MSRLGGTLLAVGFSCGLALFWVCHAECGAFVFALTSLLFVLTRPVEDHHV